MDIDSQEYANKYFSKTITPAILSLIKKDLVKVYNAEDDETPIMENLEDYYGIDLSDYYGDPDRVGELFKMLLKKKGTPYKRQIIDSKHKGM
jgi:hypothetical protein